MFHNNIEYNIVSLFKDNNGNLISLDSIIIISYFPVKIINLYAPNTNRNFLEFFGQVKEIIESSDKSYVMTCGDLIPVMDPTIDCYQYKHISNPKSKEKSFLKHL